MFALNLTEPLMFRPVLFLVLILSGTASIAQNRHAPGYIVLDNGDTLTGYIQLKGYYTAPDRVYYSKDAASKGIEYTVDNCRAFGTRDELYQRWTVKMDMSTMHELDFVIHNEGSTITDTVFLKQVYKGNTLALFKYFRGNEHSILQDAKEKMHFFLFDGGQMQELVIKYKNPIRDQTFVTRTSIYTGDLVKRKVHCFYRAQLSAYLDIASEPRLKKKIDELVYDEKNLVKIISAIDSKLK
jgi:hypothetical protein